MWLWLCIILAVLRTGLKVNVMRITMQLNLIVCINDGISELCRHLLNRFQTGNKDTPLPPSMERNSNPPVTT